jgi:hypothetical protein
MLPRVAPVANGSAALLWAGRTIGFAPLDVDSQPNLSGIESHGFEDPLGGSRPHRDYPSHDRTLIRCSGFAARLTAIRHRVISDIRERSACPVTIINDAAMRGLGSYNGGRMLFLGLGIGLGSPLIIDRVLKRKELGHLPYKNGRTYENVPWQSGIEAA